MINYFKATHTAVCYEKNAYEMFKRILIMFLDLRGSYDQKKNESQD